MEMVPLVTNLVLSCLSRPDSDAPAQPQLGGASHGTGAVLLQQEPVTARPFFPEPCRPQSSLAVRRRLVSAVASPG
jgi:hypothetical protein